MKTRIELVTGPKQFEVTRATASDIPRMAEIMSASLTEIYCDDLGKMEIPFTGPGYIRSRLSGRLADPNYLTLVATYGGEVVGVLAAEKNPQGCRVADIHLDPSSRGWGGGRRLMQRAFDWAGPQTEVRLEVLISNTDATAFYRALGFEPSGYMSLHVPPVQFIHQVMIKRGNPAP